ncbi:MAG: hypothetical protein OEV21_03680 [Thermoplasmata archaeon]|nr:hypothetical protein [Thermoplasmata archaeon]
MMISIAKNIKIKKIGNSQDIIDKYDTRCQERTFTTAITDAARRLNIVERRII